MALVNAVLMVVLVTNARALQRDRAAPVPFWVLSALLLVGVCTSVLQQGVVGVLWSYPALFIFFFVLPAAWPCRWVWRSCWAPACAAL